MSAWKTDVPAGQHQPFRLPLRLGADAEALALISRLVSTSRFDRLRSARFRRAHPELRKRLAGVLRDLEADPLQPHLRLHPLKGDLAGLHAASLTYAYRVTLTLQIMERQIILLDIGAHDELY